MAELEITETTKGKPRGNALSLHKSENCNKQVSREKL